MSWTNHLKTLRIKFGLTFGEAEVLMCLEENKVQTKRDLFETYCEKCSIEQEAFTQRLRSIYNKFDITCNGHKLPQLHNFIHEEYDRYKRENLFVSEIDLAYVHQSFPRDIFSKEINKVINLDDLENKKVDILQTFAPNLNYYYECLIQCLQNNVQVRILLAWPYSMAARLREDVLRKYSNSNINNEINICDCVIANLETLEKIIRDLDNPRLLKIKLYDTSPSVAIYRAGYCMLVSQFLHTKLAVDTSQWELNLNASNQVIAHDYQNEFEVIWKISRLFCPDPNRNWRSDLKILFTR